MSDRIFVTIQAEFDMDDSNLKDAARLTDMICDKLLDGNASVQLTQFRYVIDKE